MNFTLRPLESTDLEELVDLCAEHAEYERAPYHRAGKRAALEGFFLGESPRARCLIAQTGAGLAGYATWSREFSTWGACEYAHLDCLYLRTDWRGQGMGTALLGAVADAAAREGLAHMEWQSPIWNKGALRFYRREGGVGVEKVRFKAVVAHGNRAM